MTIKRFVVAVFALFVGLAPIHAQAQMHSITGHFIIGRADSVDVEMNWSGSWTTVGDLIALAQKKENDLSEMLAAAGQDDDRPGQWEVYTDPDRTTRVQMTDTLRLVRSSDLYFYYVAPGGGAPPPVPAPTQSDLQRNLRGYFYIGRADPVTIDMNWTDDYTTVSDVVTSARQNYPKINRLLTAEEEYDDRAARWDVYTDVDRTTQIRMTDTLRSVGTSELYFYYVAPGGVAGPLPAPVPAPTQSYTQRSIRGYFYVGQSSPLAIDMTWADSFTRVSELIANVRQDRSDIDQRLSDAGQDLTIPISWRAYLDPDRRTEISVSKTADTVGQQELYFYYVPQPIQNDQNIMRTPFGDVVFPR
jgi:hypothetical protein